MKKLGKLQVNPEKVIKNEELMTLRGGYDGVACTCKIGTTILCEPYAENCDEGGGYGSCKAACDYYCPDYEYAICVG